MNKVSFAEPYSFDSLFDRISTFIEDHSVLSNELVIAKIDFFRITGKLNESDKDFSNRMNAFLLWFAFDWKCEDYLKTPFELYKESVTQTGFNADEMTLVLDMEHHIHSLFETVKLTDDLALIRDLFSRKKYEVVQPDVLFGSRKGIYYETRIFKIGQHYRFSNYFIQHPDEVKKDVKKRCKQVKKQGDSIKPFLMQLHAYHTKWVRYRNIQLKSIYHFDKSLPEAK